MKPKLLIVELWGLGDLAIATPFLRAAADKFEVTTLLAKPFALDLQPRLWPDVKVETFIAPWTAFKHKYHLWRWPMLDMSRTRFSGWLKPHFGFRPFSARWDPRGITCFLKLMGARERFGFSTSRQPNFSEPAARTAITGGASLRIMARHAPRALGLELPPREKIFMPVARNHKIILIHTGAAQPVRVWPLENYRNLASRLRRENFQVQIACDPHQREWWLRSGEPEVATPRNVTELTTQIDRVGAFIGNDSGPGHLAAICGVPTFTLFGPQLPEWFAPLHPATEWIEGKACPYKPCSDYCRFATPFCLWNVDPEEVYGRVQKFLAAQRDVASLLSKVSD